MLEQHGQYVGREQTWVKHFVLRKYLERFGPIIGFGHSSITYVDGFSGPWKIQSENLTDTSFAIALSELRKARDTHRRRGKELRIRCVFLENDRSRFRELKAFADQVADAEVLPINSDFESAIPDVIRFIKADRDTFPFVFIDPTGWTGFSMEKIAPLLQLRPCEVLINFMLEFIRRFIEQDFTRESFIKLFGNKDFDVGLKNLYGAERDDAIAERYCRSLREVCGFDHVQRAIVLHPNVDKTHFLLLYGTRNAKGVEVFKCAEKTAMEAQEKSRARVEVRKKGQPLFDPDEMPESQHYVALRNRYLEHSRSLIEQSVNSVSQIDYDRLWECGLSDPLVWESDLRGWLQAWRDKGMVKFGGLKPREKVLKRGSSHFIVRKVEHVS